MDYKQLRLNNAAMRKRIFGFVLLGFLLLLLFVSRVNTGISASIGSLSIGIEIIIATVLLAVTAVIAFLFHSSESVFSDLPDGVKVLKVRDIPNNSSLIIEDNLLLIADMKKNFLIVQRCNGNRFFIFDSLGSRHQAGKIFRLGSGRKAVLVFCTVWTQHKIGDFVLTYKGEIIQKTDEESFLVENSKGLNATVEDVAVFSFEP